MTVAAREYAPQASTEVPTPSRRQVPAGNVRAAARNAARGARPDDRGLLDGDRGVPGGLGAGIGLTMQVVVLIVQNTAPIQHLGAATSTVTFARSIGGSLGVALFGALFNARLGEQIAARLPASAQARIPDASAVTPEALHQLPHAFQVAFTHALTPVFAAAVPILGGAFVLTLLLNERPLRTRPALVAESDA